MRVTTAFNKMLAIEGATVAGHLRTAGNGCRPATPGSLATLSLWVLDQGPVRLLHQTLASPGPGDLQKLFLRAEIRRLSCPRCARVRT
jgi:hypothetical protein